jgi:hypothetical protein
MTLTISISPEAETKLREQAAVQGTDVVQYARQLIEHGVGASNGADLRAGEPDRLSTLNAFVARVRREGSRYPAGFIVDDGRESIYEGRGE